MDIDPGGSQEKILKALAALQDQVRSLGVRLDVLEKSGGVRANATVLENETRQHGPPPIDGVEEKGGMSDIAAKPISRLPHLPSIAGGTQMPLVGPEVKAAPGRVDLSIPVNETAPRTLGRIGMGDPSKISRPFKSRESLEVQIAGTWLPRIGVFCLALVLILIARQHVHGPVGKVVGCYVLSAALTGIGIWQSKKFPRWAAPVLAGGLAFSYFTSYALGFVEPMRLLDSMPAKLAVLGVNLVCVFGFAQWKRSEVIAGTALVLGYLTTGVVGNDLAALCSTMALSIIALMFLARNNWFVSTALAAGATYLASFYIWKAVPEVAQRSQAEEFWFRFIFLSLAFIIYTTAGFAGRRTALTESIAEKPDAEIREMPGIPTRANLLALMTQANVAAYVAGMIMVFRLTHVYWDHAWIFFFPVAVLFGCLLTMFDGLRPVQITYVIAAAVCFTFGVISVSSPLWLPIFLALQAVVMLLGARRRKYGEIWAGLSLLVAGYAMEYLLTGGQIGWLDRSQLGTSYPSWTFATVTAIILVYGGVWERFPVGKKGDVQHGRLVACAAAVGAFMTWYAARGVFSGPDSALVYYLAVPVVTAATVFARSESPIVFIILIILSYFSTNDFLLFSDQAHSASYLTTAGLGIAGLCGAWLAERQQFSQGMGFRILAISLYLWSQLILAAAISTFSDQWFKVLEYVSVFTITIVVGWLARSSALAKSGFLAVAPALIYAMDARRESIWLPALCILLLMVAAYPLGMPAWRRRTGDRWPIGNRWGQAAVMVVAGWILMRFIFLTHGNLVFVAGFWAMVCSIYAATGRFRAIIFVVIFFSVVMCCLICIRVSGIVMSGTEMSPSAETVWSLLGVLSVVAAERILKLAHRFSFKWSNEQSWLKADNRIAITNGLAIGTLAFAVIAMRIEPHFQLFYFTGAVVVAAFVWIVFGFLFNEPVYRKSGFLLLCIGIMKGLVWDVLSLKNTFYRQISWTVTGLLALAASFLYSRFRGRIESPDHTGESFVRDADESGLLK